MKVFFDLDGTLSDVRQRHYRVYSDSVHVLGGQPLPMTTYWQLKRDNMAWPMVLERSGVNGNRSPEFLDAFVARIERPDYLKLDELFSGSLHTLAAIAPRFSRYLVSLRRHHDLLVTQIDRLGLAPHFEHVRSSASGPDASDTKFRLMREELSSGEFGVIVGDTEADVRSGKRLGLMTVAVSTGVRSAEFLAKLEPTRLLTRIEDLPPLLEAGAACQRTRL
jgi:phosphoglycolate phosphatase-like HAD superfamily hydrolase